MWKGREIVPCASALFAGNFLGDFLPLSPVVYLALAFIVALLALFFRKMPVMLLSLVLTGALSLQVQRMPPLAGESALEASARRSKDRFSAYLETIFTYKEAATRVSDADSTTVSDTEESSHDDELAIFKALAIGDKSEIDYNLKDAYRKSGAMHLLALSGLHVGIIYALISALFSIFGGNRAVQLVRSIVTVAFLWQFALISGLSPSIFRAVLMITFYEIAGLVSADRDGPAALAGSAVVIMLLEPEAPRELSFLLSYSAIIGIYTIYPRLSALMDKDFQPDTSRLCGFRKTLAGIFLTSIPARLMRKSIYYVWQVMCMSISCQATCGLLAYCYFGTFPKYFLLTNLLAVPLATLVMYAAAAAILTSFSPTLGTLTSKLLHLAIHLLNTTIRLLAEM
ncbi:MAG: ComEC/Rec2 family competence protein [Bacteroidales bacterium]|nr:ComEC/Rec2 family competence protein [Candidatus Cacconaster merdequi]